MSIYVTTLVWKFSKAEGSTLLTALAIADFADDDGRAFPSVSTLAKKARVCTRTVQYNLNLLKEYGELVVETGTGPKGCNTYCIQVQNLRGANSAGVQNTAEGGAAGCTQTIIEPSSSSLNEKKKAPKHPNPCPDILPQEAWESFVAHRKAKRAPLTTKAISLIGKTLMQAKFLGFDPAELLNRSVMNGWTGVFIPQTQANRPASTKAQQNDEWRDWLSDKPQGGGHVVDVVATEVRE